MNIIRILIVEDDALMSEMISTMIRRHDAQIKMVGTLAHALGAVSSTVFHAVLLDLMLPDSTVETSLASVARFKQLGVSRVIIITATPIDERLIEAAQQYGADDIIGKDDLDFEKRVREILK